MDNIKRFLKDPIDGWYFIQGTVRYSLIKNLPFLVRGDIKKVYNKRKELAKECYLNGECLCCGCKTPEVLLADKGCKAEQYQHCDINKACYEDMRTMIKNLKNV